MKRSGFLLLFTLLAACSGDPLLQKREPVPENEREQEAPPTPSAEEKKPLSLTAPVTTADYMKNQEYELQQAIAETPFEVVRENNTLAVVLTGTDAFPTSEQLLSPTAENVLKKVANVLTRYDKTHISIIGYADSGEPSSDRIASEKRAEAVAGVLKKSAKIADVRFWIEGSTPSAGEEPLSDDDRQKNNHVDIILVPTFIQ